MEHEGSRLKAVIDIGSTAIRLLVAEIGPDGDWKVIDRAGKPVLLGRDSFGSGSIGRTTMNQSLDILASFRELIDGWGISEENVTVIATSALREARNRDTFVDRIALKTGFNVTIVEGLEASRLTYLAVNDALQDIRAMISRSNSIIIEVGGGSTELMLLQRGKIVAAHSLKIGIIRAMQQIEVTSGTSDHLVVFLRENIRTIREVLENEFSLDRIRYFIAVGGDARLAARRAGSSDNPRYSIIAREAFDDFLDSISPLSVDECVHDLQISYAEADGLATSLSIYRMFLESTAAEDLIVPNVSIREGVLLDGILGPERSMREQFDSQIVASAESLGRKFHYDEAHARHVSFLSLRLFDLLRDEHGLDEHARILLHIAGILHDIGTYVGTSGHHKHGMYLIMNSDIFGLHGDDIAIIGNIVRYHRKGGPAPAHTEYITLPREERILVLKLASILRIADALDRGHVQRVIDIETERSGDTLRIRPRYEGDISVERFGMATKANLFEEVFGVTAILE